MYAAAMGGGLVSTLTILFRGADSHQLSYFSFGCMVSCQLLFGIAGSFFSGYWYRRIQTTCKESIENHSEFHYENGKWNDVLPMFSSWVQPEVTCRYAIDALAGRKRPYSEDSTLMRKIFEVSIYNLAR